MASLGMDMKQSWGGAAPPCTGLPGQAAGMSPLSGLSPASETQASRARSPGPALPCSARVPARLPMTSSTACLVSALLLQPAAPVAVLTGPLPCCRLSAQTSKPSWPQQLPLRQPSSRMQGWKALPMRQR